MLKYLSRLVSRTKAQGKSPAQTGSYESQAGLDWGRMPRDLLPFNWEWARLMLWDPTIRLGLAMRAAPIQSAELAYKEGDSWKSGIKCDNPGVAVFVQRQVERFWKHDLHKILRAQIWGWAAGEVTYRLTKTGQVEYEGLSERNARDVRALEYHGQQIGVRFRRIKDKPEGYVDLRFPECFWHAFGPEDGSHYGNSVLRGCYSPWSDKYLTGGALDVRRLFMHKDAYGGVDVSYPQGTTWIDGKGAVPNQDIARQIAQQIKAGGVTTRPSEYDTTGKEKWVITRATVPASPKHILDYPKDLDTEMLRGLGIPDDVLTSEGMTGAWAGKAVPQQAFYTSLDGWVTQIATGFQRQVVDALVYINFGQVLEYEICFKPLADQANEQSGDKEEAGKPFNPFAPRMSNNGSPFAMALAEQAVGEGVLSARNLVQAARRVMQSRRRKKIESSGHA